MINMVKNLFLSCFIAFFVFGCTTPSSGGGCSKDTDCAAGFDCDLTRNTCACLTDDVCKDGEFCNSLGQCQRQPPCRGNDDCPSGFICNAEGQGDVCIPAGHCGADVHCRIGQRCDVRAGTCVTGCSRKEDCPLGHACVAGSCTPGACQICPIDPEPNASYCSYGDRCTSDGRCLQHPIKSSLCQACGPLQRCPTGSTCLIDNEGGNYCAPQCQIESDCPSGYQQCSGLSLVTTECSNDSGCSGGRKCLKGGEERGFCECLSTSECGIGISICTQGACMGTGFSCTTNADCGAECIQEPGPDGRVYGMCRTRAHACGKQDGFTCNTLRSSPAACTATQDDPGPL